MISQGLSHLQADRQGRGTDRQTKRTEFLSSKACLFLLGRLGSASTLLSPRGPPIPSLSRVLPPFKASFTVDGLAALTQPALHVVFLCLSFTSVFLSSTVFISSTPVTCLIPEIESFLSCSFYISGWLRSLSFSWSLFLKGSRLSPLPRCLF